MFSLTIRRHFMIAHSLPREVFGPAQGLHGATFVAEVMFRRRALNKDAIVLDIGAAGGIIEDVLAGLNYTNLDEHPDFAGEVDHAVDPLLVVRCGGPGGHHPGNRRACCRVISPSQAPRSPQNDARTRSTCWS